MRLWCLLGVCSSCKVVVYYLLQWLNKLEPEQAPFDKALIKADKTA